MRIALAVVAALLGWLTIQPPLQAQDATPPRLRDAACFIAPPEGMDADCGYLTVPERHDGDPKDTIQLAYMRYRTTAAEPGAPLVYLSGGPGASGIEELGDGGWLLPALVRTRDVIVFDQRGAGYSIPSLNCTEWQDEDRAALPDETDYAEIAGCRDYWTARGVDLTAYTTTASAADIAALITALDYPQAILLGASYGSKLALVTMRNHPELVAAAVLDGAVPVQTNQEIEHFAKHADALEQVFALCAADQACAAFYPRLRERFYDLVAQWSAEPIAIAVSAAGEEWTELVYGADLIGLMFTDLFNGAVAVEEFPYRIAQFERGDYSFLSQIYSDYYLPDPLFGDALEFTIHCGEEVLLATPAELAQRLDALPEFAAAWRAHDLENDTRILEECRVWGAQPADPTFAEAVVSDIPTLILQGGLDFQTPTRWALQAREGLSNSTLVYFPTLGHVISLDLQTQCPAALVAQFAADPAAPLDTACMAGLPALSFYIPHLVTDVATKPILLFSDDGAACCGTDVPATWFPTAAGPNEYSPGSAEQWLFFAIFDDARDLDAIAEEIAGAPLGAATPWTVGERTWQVFTLEEAGAWTGVYALYRAGDSVHLAGLEGIFVAPETALQAVLRPALAAYRIGDAALAAFQPVSFKDAEWRVTLHTVTPPDWTPLPDNPLGYADMAGDVYLFVSVYGPEKDIVELAREITEEEDPETRTETIGNRDWTLFTDYEEGWWYTYAVTQDRRGAYMLELAGAFFDPWPQAYDYVYPMMAAFAVSR